MYGRLALRHLVVHPGRALVLLLGYALGVAVMIVLLSVGRAMLDQARDAALIGGGDLTVLPQGVDVEAMRTGGLSGMFFGISGAHFITRELLGGPRQARLVAAVSPVIERKLAALSTRDTTFAVRAGADLPAEARDAGASLHLIAGHWRSLPRDTEWIHPTPQQLYDGIDHFHRPDASDSSWAEWHYFNVIPRPGEWWYITLMVFDRPPLKWGGEVLVTRRAADGRYQRFTAPVPRDQVVYDTMHADVSLGATAVSQRDGIYHLRGRAGIASFDLAVRPVPHQYFPPIEIGTESHPSGYVVPALVARASGRVCIGGHCDSVIDAPAYHDHNWGGWSGVTWEWGTGTGPTNSLLYGGIVPADRTARVPLILALADSLGVEQIYRFSDVRRWGQISTADAAGHFAPESLLIVASHRGDTVRLRVGIHDAAVSRSAAVQHRLFVQMRGRWTLTGTALGKPVRANGSGFFETWEKQ